MKISAVSMAGIFFALGIASADVVTNATCQVGTNPAVSNASSCSINATNSRPSARASVVVNQLTSIPDGGISSPISVDVTGSASAIPLESIPTGPNISSSASANTRVTYQLFTPGPVRTGVLTYLNSISNWQVGAGDNPAVFSVSVGSLSGSCGGMQPFCTGSILGSPLLALTQLIKALGGTEVPTATREVQPVANTATSADASTNNASGPVPAVSEEALRKLQSVRDHLGRYRELSSQGKWAEAGKELDEIQRLVQK